MEIAIPLVVLAGSYIIANDDKKKKQNEGFVSGTSNKLIKPTDVSVHDNTTSMSYNNNSKLNTSTLSSKTSHDWSVKNEKLQPNDSMHVQSYPNSNCTTDQYFVDSSTKVRLSNKSPSVSANGGGQAMSLTGGKIDPDNFDHNNMVPFFGGKVRGCGPSHDAYESTLDSMQGAGSQHIRKKEQGTLFKPQKHLSNISGAPNNNDFIHSRMNASLRNANVLPWEKKQVGPGLNAGYGTDGQNGYNAGVDSRESWKPKTVDQLRVSTNPKETYHLAGHEGPSISSIKEPATIKTQGNVEKYRPDTYYSNGPNRWLTTTGDILAPTSQAKQMLPDTNRHNVPFSYFGASSGEKDAPTARGQYSAPKRTALKCAPLGTPSAAGTFDGDKHNYGASGFTSLPNNRTTVCQETVFGNIKGTVNALMTPILDTLNPTRKQDTIHNMRINGNVSGQVSAGAMINPGEKTKVTNREMTESKLAHGYQVSQGAQTGGYQITNPILKNGQRNTTNTQYIGVAGPTNASAQMSKESAYRQYNPDKEQPSRPNPGGMQVFNNSQNINIRKSEENQEYNRTGNPANLVGKPLAVSQYGKLNGPSYQSTKSASSDAYIDPGLLDAFKNNPYTQSLQSVA